MRSRMPASATSPACPFSLKILLENLLRHEDGLSVTKDDVAALAAWDPRGAV